MQNPPKKKIWIDLENTPHVPFFRPIIEELDRRGYSTFLTARDCSQTCGLADLLGVPYKRIGRHYGKNKLLKLYGLFARVMRFTPLVMKEKPDLALSHGSRTQMLLASFLGIRSLEIIDYEYTKTLPLSRPDWMVVPEVLANGDIDMDKNRILQYPGIKEDIYVPTFTPDAAIREALSIQASDLVVTVRPPATDAHYFVSESQELFMKTMEYLESCGQARLILLPRNANQDAFIRKSWPRLIEERTIIIPDIILDGLNLLWHSDLVISGGGTMNREAAALGVPVYSIFRGKIGAVDRYLADTGRLVLLENADDLRSKLVLERRPRPDRPDHLNTAAFKTLVNTIIAVADAADEKRIQAVIAESTLRKKR